MKRSLFFCVFLALFSLCNSSKAQGVDSLQNIHVIVTFASPPAVYNVAKAPLRFNKLFAFSMGEDDGTKDIYTNAFPLFNGGVINGVGYPGLKYTDGCGNDQNFKLSAAIFSLYAQGSILVDMHDPSGQYASTIVTWPQLIELYEQNWSIQNHGLTSGNVGTMGYQVARNGSYVKLMMQPATAGGPDLKTFVNPNGIEAYSSFAWAQGYTICFREGYAFGNPGFNVSGPFPHQNIGMHRANGYEAVSLSAIADNLANTSVGGAHQWGAAFTHSITNSSFGYAFSTFQNQMTYIANTYGKNGLDNILMTTEEEVIDYLMVRDSINVNTQLNGNVLTISFTGNLTNKYRFYNSTLLISANQNITSIATQGVQSNSYNGIGSTNGMVNISWNGHYVVPPEVNAEAWVSKTETSQSQEDANVAMDYILMVPPGPVQKAFRIRLCLVPGLTLPSDFCTYHNAPVTSIPDKGGCPGHPLVIPLEVDSFLNVKSFNLRLEYSPAVMAFVSGAAGKPSILSGILITDQAVGGISPLRKILISWTGAAAQSLNIHDTLALLTFNYLSGNTPLTFNTASNGGADCRYSDDGGNPMYQYPIGDYFIGSQVTNSKLAAPATISGPSPLCAGTPNNTYIISPVTGATSYAWNFPVGFTVNNGSANDTVVATAGPNAVTGNITVRAVNICIDNPLSPPFTVTVKPRPVPTLNGVDSACMMDQGVVYTTEAGMTDYTWSVSYGGTITSGMNTNTVAVTWTAAGQQTISVIYRGTNGCLAPLPTIKNVTVNPLPIPAISGADTLCRNALSTYTAPSGMQSYQWLLSPSGVILSGTSSSAVTVKWNNPGQQWISLNCTNSSGCQPPSPTVYNVFVRPVAQPVISGPDSLCAEVSDIVYTTQPGMNAYSWSVTTGGTITSGSGTASATVHWTSPGMQQIHVNYILPGGCQSPAPFILPVRVFARPQPHIMGPDSLCNGSTGTVYNTESGMNNYQWTITPGGTITSGSSLNTITVDWNAAGNQQLSVTYSNEKGCQALQPVLQSVRIHPLPVPWISGLSNSCVNSSNQIYHTQSGKSNYFWTISSGGVIDYGQNTDSVRVNWVSTGLQHLTVNYLDSNNCMAVQPASFAVNVHPVPLPTISGSSSVCQGAAGITYTTQSGMGNYLWTISPGGIIQSGTGTQAITVRWDSAGSQTVTVNYTNSSGCFALAATEKNVMVHPLPVPTINGPDSLCMNETGTYTTETGMGNYQWVISPGGSIVTGMGTNTINVTWTSSGPRTISVSYLSVNNCLPYTPTVFHVNVFPLPVPQIIGNTTVCANSSNVPYKTESGMSNYLWTLTGSGAITSGQNTDSITTVWGNPGTSTLTVTYASTKGCNPVTPAIVTVIPLLRPVPMINGNNSVCINSGTKDYSTQTGQLDYIWVISAGDSILSGGSTSSVTVQWNNSGSRWISATYTSPSGCPALSPDTMIVSVNPLPLPASSVSGPFLLCVPAFWQEYSVSPITNASGYFWTLPAGSIFQGSPNSNVIHVGYLENVQSDSVTVYGTNACGNGTPSSLFVTLNPIPPQPTITPGQNDTIKSSSPYGNQWYLNDQLLPGDTLDHLYVSLSGDYYIIVRMNGCVSDTSEVYHGIAVGTLAIKGLSIEVHPNPTNGRLILDFSSPVENFYTVIFFNELGMTICRSEKLIPAGKSSWFIDLGNISPGLVILTIQSAEGIIRKRIIII
ncbi:MAG: hypothetical protein WCO02_02070 [Bacteroidota bacterium]